VLLKKFINNIFSHTGTVGCLAVPAVIFEPGIKAAVQDAVSVMLFV
jgi:hypothetical protein